MGSRVCHPGYYTWLLSWIPQKTQPGFWPHEHILLHSQAGLWGVLWKSAVDLFLIAQIISEALFCFSTDCWTPSCVLFCMAAGSMGQRHWQSPMCFDLYISFSFATLIPFPLRFLGINYKEMLASEEHFWGHLIWRHVFKLLVSSIMCFVAGELQWVNNSSYTFCSLSFAYIKYYFLFFIRHLFFNFTLHFNLSSPSHPSS